MKINLKLLLLLITSLNAQAGLMVEFDSTPAEQIEVNNVLTENANIFLSVDARLDYPNDFPGMKVILGYDFWCTGDNIAAKNIAQQTKAHSELIGFKLRYDTARPNLWDEWPSGSKTCTLTWKGGAHRYVSESGASITSSISGLGSSIGFTFTSPQPTTQDHETKVAQKVFTMIKPSFMGGFCENPF